MTSIVIAIIEPNRNSSCQAKPIPHLSLLLKSYDFFLACLSISFDFFVKHWLSGFFPSFFLLFWGGVRGYGFLKKTIFSLFFYFSFFFHFLYRPREQVFFFLWSFVTYNWVRWMQRDKGVLRMCVTCRETRLHCCSLINQSECYITFTLHFGIYFWSRFEEDLWLKLFFLLKTLFTGPSLMFFLFLFFLYFTL